MNQPRSQAGSLPSDGRSASRLYRIAPRAQTEEAAPGANLCKDYQPDDRRREFGEQFL